MYSNQHQYTNTLVIDQDGKPREFQVHTGENTSTVMHSSPYADIYVVPDNRQSAPPVTNEPKVWMTEDGTLILVEEEVDLAAQFGDSAIRRAFLRKVFLLLMVLLGYTAGYIAVCIYVEPVRDFWQEHPLFILSSLPVTIVTISMIMCCSSNRRKFPLNYILLFLFASSVTFMVGGLCSLIEANYVMIAFGMTATLCLGLTIFACQTKYDFTVWSSLLVVILLLLPLSAPAIFFLETQRSLMAFSILGVFILSIIFIIDVQYIVRGDHRYKISPEEYIFAVAILYIDIIVLFLRILRILRYVR